MSKSNQRTIPVQIISYAKSNPVWIYIVVGLLAAILVALIILANNTAKQESRPEAIPTQTPAVIIQEIIITATPRPVVVNPLMTVTPLPTGTPVPTATVLPTVTPRPTATQAVTIPIPTYDPCQEYLGGSDWINICDSAGTPHPIK